MQRRDGDLYPVIARALFLATGLFLTLWFIHQTVLVLLTFVSAAILAVALNGPISWLERRKVPRVLGTVIVICGQVAVAVGIVSMAVPVIAKELRILGSDLPAYATSLSTRISPFLARYPDIRERLHLDGRGVEQWGPALTAVLVRVGNYSLSAVEAFLLLIVLLTTACYLVVNPRPLILGGLRLLPEPWREPATRAFTCGSETVINWIWSNLVLGGLEGVVAAIFLALLGIPGAVVWGVLAVFAELIPKLGPYLMAIPPIIVALAVSPIKAVWVALFYIVLQEVAFNLIGPMVRSSRVDLHPVSVLFVVLVLGELFGLLGVLIAIPVAGYVKAFYAEFRLSRMAEDERVGELVEDIVQRRCAPRPPSGS